jgi:CheY-like chemotaxis protein
MTPRQADVAFVLEGMPGVRAVYAVEDPRLSANCEFAVEIDSIAALVAAHYALLRVLTNEDCERVQLLTTGLPPRLARAARRLTLDWTAREAARARVPPVPPRPRLDVGPQNILLVDRDPATAALIREHFPGFVLFAATSTHEGVLLAKSSRPWSLVVLEAQHAFGPSGVLRRLPFEQACRALVIVPRSELADARWRIGDPERILTRPLSVPRLWRALVRSSGEKLASATTEPADPAPARTVVSPPFGAALRVLLVDVEADFDLAFGRAFGGAIEFVAKKSVDDAIAYALSNPVSVIICGKEPALAPRSFIDGIAREDAAAGRRIIVAVQARDVVRVRGELARAWRRNRVIALPVEEVTLRAAVLRSHPELARPATRHEEAPNIVRPAFRRVAALVVDDESSTQILFSSGLSIDDADVALETTSLGAFEHVLSRPVDLLFVSASMRSDSGEPFYRTLWRVKQELKPRTVLITEADAAPPSARDTKLPRILERPASRARIAEIIAAYRRA